MHAVHLNTNSWPVNVDHILQGSQTSNDGGVAPIGNDHGPINEKIKHPHLTGIYWYIA